MIAVAHRRPVEASEQVQQRRLAAAGAPQHRDDLAGVDTEGDAVEHTPGRATDTHGLRDPARFQDRHRGDGSEP